MTSKENDDSTLVGGSIQKKFQIVGDPQSVKRAIDKAKKKRDKLVKSIYSKQQWKAGEAAYLCLPSVVNNADYTSGKGINDW